MVQKKLGKPKASQADHEQQYRELIQLLEQPATPRVQKPFRPNQSRPRKR